MSEVDELVRLGAAARSELAAAPRLRVSEVKGRGRRRRRRHRVTLTGSTAVAMAVVVATGALAVSRREETTTAGNGPPATHGIRPLPTLDRRAWPAAILAGRLVVEDGCVYFLQGDLRPARQPGGTTSGIRALVIWKAGHRLVDTPHGRVVIAPDGTELPTDGSPVELGGGLAPREVLDQADFRQVPRDCVTAELAFAVGPATLPPPTTPVEPVLPSWPPATASPTSKVPMPPQTSP